MASAMIDVKNGRLSLQVGEQKLEFILFEAMSPPPPQWKMLAIGLMS